MRLVRLGVVTRRPHHGEGGPRVAAHHGLHGGEHAPGGQEAALRAELVEVDGVVLQSTFISSMQLMFIAPEHAEGFADIVVQNPDGLFDEFGQ